MSWYFVVTLFHCYIVTGDGYSASYLLENGCDVNLSDPIYREMPLHLLASLSSSTASLSISSLGELLLKKGAKINATDCQGKSVF